MSKFFQRQATSPFLSILADVVFSKANMVSVGCIYDGSAVDEERARMLRKRLLNN